MRIFLAIRFSPAVQRSLTDAMAQLRRLGIRGNYTRPENLHLTLAFLGETTRLREIHAAVDAVEFAPFDLRLGQPGRFRDLLWLGLAEAAGVSALAASLRQSLARQGIPFDRTPFQAHITLVRRAEPALLPRLELPDAAMRVTHISVMQSERIGGKLIYTERS